MRAAGVLAFVAGLLLVTVAALPSCVSTCAVYVVQVVVEDESTGNLLCDAHVTLLVGDSGTVDIDASTAPSDAEIAPSSSVCQWDTISGGGTFTITASAPGFAPGSASVELPTDVCGSNNVPVTVYLSRS